MSVYSSAVTPSVLDEALAHHREVRARRIELLVMLRALLGMVVGLTLLLVADSAEADIAPPGPARPSWEDTPLPMPEDPPPDPAALLIVAGLGLVALGTIATLGRRRALAE